MRLLISIWFISWSLCTLGQPNSTDVENRSYLTAKVQSEESDLNYMLYFHAKWSAPCRWMDNVTWVDERVVSTLNNDVIFVPLNIDHFEGFALKEYFQVNSLPAILLFNSAHELINREEAAVSADRLIAFLQTDHKMHFNPSVQAINRLPAPLTAAEQKSPLKITEPIEVDSLSVMTDDLRQFVVQVGVYQSYERAQNKYQQMKNLVQEPVHIHVINQENGSSLFQIFVGKYNERSNARQLANMLAEVNVDGFVKSVVTGEKG